MKLKPIEKRICCMTKPRGIWRCYFCGMGWCYLHIEDMKFGIAGLLAHENVLQNIKFQLQSFKKQCEMTLKLRRINEQD